MTREEIASYLERNYKGENLIPQKGRSQGDKTGGSLTAKNGEKVMCLLGNYSMSLSRGTLQKVVKNPAANNENIIRNIQNTRLMLFFGVPDNIEDSEELSEKHKKISEKHKKLLNELSDYIFSIEPFTSSTTSFNLPQNDEESFEPLKADCEKYPDVGIYKIKISGSKVKYNLVMIRVKEDGKEVAKYMDAYLASSDSRTFHDVKHTAAYTPRALVDTKENSKDSGGWPHNLLIFGAPGTGKSHCIKEKLDELGWNKNMQRVTFYEDYSYEKFVGAYLPRAGKKTSTITGTNGENKTVDVTSVTENSIEYSFVPGVFLNMIADAWFDLNFGENEHFVLVIEEINRANAASVFGDFFQLLDRGSNGVSDYPIALSHDMRDALCGYLLEKGEQKFKGDSLESFKRCLNDWLDDFRLPGNLYLWATMNSADQGVYPMDAAFKRRWSYLYKTTQEQRNKSVYIRWNNGKAESKWLSWDALKWAINTVMENNGNIEEDRFIGPWFFKDAELDQINAFTAADEDARKNMPDPLTNKLFQYLRQDVFRNNPGQIFKDGYYTMSKIRMGMINGVGLNEILKLDDNNAKIPVENEDGSVEEKLISELLTDKDPTEVKETEQQENKSDETALPEQESAPTADDSKQQENETSGEAAAQQES